MIHHKAMWAQSFRFTPSSEPSCCNAMGCTAPAQGAVPASSSQTRSLWGRAQGTEPSLGSGMGLPKPKQLCSNFRSGRKSTSKEITRMPFPHWNGMLLSLLLSTKIYTLPCYNASWSLTPLTVIWPFAILELPWHLQALFSNFSVSRMSLRSQKKIPQDLLTSTPAW